MVSFQSIVLLESMIKKTPRIVFCVSATTSLKNKIEVSRIVFCISEATSFKNEIEVYEHDFLISSSLENETRLEHSFLISSSLKNETTYEDSFCVSEATSLKNETEVMSIVLFLCQAH
jgi:hypothetical protein